MRFRTDASKFSRSFDVTIRLKSSSLALIDVKFYKEKPEIMFAGYFILLLALKRVALTESVSSSLKLSLIVVFAATFHYFLWRFEVTIKFVVTHSRRTLSEYTDGLVVLTCS